MEERSFDEYKELVDQHLMDFIPNIDNKSISLYESMKYSLTAGGKRLRPVLLLAACEFAGGNIKEAIPYACAIEYIHTYSLIHDDLPAMDNDDLRRGLPTNHKVMLFYDSPEKIRKRVNAAYEIAKGAGVRGMVAGQVSDIEAENAIASKEMLEYIHLNKTGALIRAAIKAGLYLGNPTDSMINDLEKYSENLGIAYQIADDIMDVVGNPDEMGKAAGSDEKKHKNTYTSILDIDHARNRLDELTAKAVESIEKYYDNAEFFRNLVLDLAKRTK